MNSPYRPTRSSLRDIARRAMVQRGFLPDFSAEALAETRSALPAAADPSIRDLRGLLWCSVDNDDSRDLDQLTVATSPATMLVAIADVDALVPLGSAVDRHAAVNTTSVYTPAQVFPMLPERFSTDLTSLNENEDRLAVVVEMTIDRDGVVEASEVSRGLVRNRAKLAYPSVGAWLDGQAPPPPKLTSVAGLEEQLRLQDAAAQMMARRRQRYGALNLKTVESKAVFTGEVLSDLRVDDKNRAKELIENFMIAANGVTANYLSRKGVPSIRRILRAPERWDRIVELAESLDESLPEEPSAPDLETFLLKRLNADPLRFPDLSLSVVKLLGSGEYAVEFPGKPLEGHFGLAVRDYAHSTAPNRRYPDLVTQRLLKAAIAGRPSPYPDASLEELARHCTEQEDDATKVERQVRKSAAALLLEARAGERFDGLVTGASDKGTWVRIFRPPVEGRIMRGAEGLDVGDRVRVELVATDVDRGYIDFVRA